MQGASYPASYGAGNITGYPMSTGSYPMMNAGYSFPQQAMASAGESLPVSLAHHADKLLFCTHNLIFATLREDQLQRKLVKKISFECGKKFRKFSLKILKCPDVHVSNGD
jgi:hypothetical protein